MMETILRSDETASVWEQIVPHLNDALDRLPRKDREAVLVRFFQDKSHRELARTLGVSEDAAKVRVSRALEKLRLIFARQGFAVPSAVLLATISAHGAQAAPAGLTASVASMAVAKGTVGTTSTLTIAKGVLKIMAWTKAKTIVVASVAVLFAAGTATVTVKEIQKHRHYHWQVENADSRLLNSVSPQINIVPTIFSPREGWAGYNGKMIGMGQSISNLLAIAYDTSKYRMVFLTKLPDGHYDFIANLPAGNKPAMQTEIKKQFHLIGARTEMHDTDVLLLTVKHQGAPGLRPNANKSSDSNNNGAGYYHSANVPLSKLAGFLEYYFEMPVLDHTGLAGRFDINIKWPEQDWEHRNSDALKQVLLDELGLEMVPSREPVEMLVVEKAK